jgi:hypothetical protein
MYETHAKLAKCVNATDGLTDFIDDKSPVYLRSKQGGFFEMQTMDAGGEQLTLGDLRTICDERND